LKQFEHFGKSFMTILQEVQPYGQELCELVHWFCKYVERVPKFRAFFAKYKDKFALVKKAIGTEKENIENGGMVTLRRVRYSCKGKPKEIEGEILGLRGVASVGHRQKVLSLFERTNAIFDQETLPDKTSEWDSDVDLSEYHLKVGDLIDFRYPNFPFRSPLCFTRDSCPNSRGPEWIEAEVKEVFDEMIFIQYQRDDLQMEPYSSDLKKDWIPRDSEQLAPANTKRLPPLESPETEETDELQFGNGGSENGEDSSGAEFQEEDQAK
jgi:hypothetical protein